MELIVNISEILYTYCWQDIQYVCSNGVRHYNREKATTLGCNIDSIIRFNNIGHVFGGC